MIENLLSVALPRTKGRFYHTAAGAEMDLVLELAGRKCWAIEIKSGLTPIIGKGFHNAIEDIQPDKSFVVYSGNDRYPLAENTEVISLLELAKMLSEME